MNLQRIRTLLRKSDAFLLIAYVFFTILPHFAAIIHSHIGGGAPHTHAFLSVHDENVKREVLEDMGNVSGLKSVSMPAEVQETVVPKPISLERGTQGLQPANFWHTHFQEDPNLLSLGAALALPLILLALRRSEKFRLPFVPALLKFRPVARGPPLSLPA